MSEKSYEDMKIEFRKLYFKTIRPLLVEYEIKRKNFVPKMILGFVFIFFFIATLLLFVISTSISIAKPVYIVFFAGVIGSFFILKFLTRNDTNDDVQSGYNDYLKEKLMRGFLSVFSNDAKWFGKYAINSIEKAEEYRKLNFFDSLTYTDFDDKICLSHKNVDITIFDTNTLALNLYFVEKIWALLFPFVLITILIWSVHLFYNGVIPFVLLLIILFVLFCFSQKILQAPFKGVVIELKMNKKFKGHTFFLNKSLYSIKNSVDDNKYESVNLESVAFMNKYRVFSTDQIEARYLLTAAMIDRLEKLKIAFHSNYIRASFKDDKLILAIDTGRDMFSMGNNLKISTYKTFENLFGEIVAIMKVVDQLKVDYETGL